MDPSASLLLHSSPFGGNTVGNVTTFSEWLESNIFQGTLMGRTLANPYYKSKDARGPAAFAEEQEGIYADPEIEATVNEKKDALGYILKEQLRVCRDKANPFEELVFRPFMNRAALKLANIDAVFSLSYKSGLWDKPAEIDQVEARYSSTTFLKSQTFDTWKDDKPEPSITTKDLFYFADIAGAPGGMSEYLLWRRPMSQGFGISLRGKEKALKWNSDKLDSERFRVNLGSERDGDLFKMENITSFSSYVKKSVGAGVNLAVADGGFDFTGDENRQEENMARLLICQCLTILMSLRGGGSCVVKFFDITKLITVQLVQYMADVFDNICIFKPISSRPANSERYLVCRGLQGDDVLSGVVTRLKAAVLRYAAGQNITSLFPEDNIDPDLIDYIYQNNDELMSSQIASLEAIIACANPTEEDEPLPSYHLGRAWRVWYLPEPPAADVRCRREDATGKIKCYNCQGEGHMSGQCDKPKKPYVKREDRPAKGGRSTTRPVTATIASVRPAVVPTPAPVIRIPVPTPAAPRVTDPPNPVTRPAIVTPVVVAPRRPLPAAIGRANAVVPRVIAPAVRAPPSPVVRAPATAVVRAPPSPAAPAGRQRAPRPLPATLAIPTGSAYQPR